MAKTQTKTKVSQKKTRFAAFKLTPEQYATIEVRAEERGMRVGTWMRSIVLQAAAAPRKGSWIRINEPNGAIS